MASIGELFIELGVKADTQKVNQINTGFKSLKTNLLLTAAAFTGAIVGLDRFVNSALKGVVALQNINAQTGLSIEKLQQFQQAGQLSNIALSADQIANSLATAQKNLKLLSIGGGNLAPFQMLGIDAGSDNIFTVFEKLRDNINGIDPSIVSSLISDLGLSPDFINLLKKSREEFEALGENTFLNPTQRADIDKVGTSIKALTLRFKALKDQAVAKIAPELNKLVQQFFKWMKDNGKKIVDTIASIAKGFAKFAGAVGNAFNLIVRFTDGLVGAGNGIKVLAAAFALLTLSLSPFLLGLAAVVLLLDDIMVFKSGGDSIIGELVKAFEDLPSLADVFDGGVNITDIMDGITDAMILMTVAAVALAAPLVAIVGALSFLSKAPQFGKFIANKIDKTKTGQGVGDFLLNSKGFFGNWLDANKNVLKNGFKKPEFGGSGITNNNTYNIQGLNAPEIGQEIKRGQKSQESLNRTQASQGSVF